MRVLLLHVQPVALTTLDARVCWRRALGGKKALAAHAFPALPDTEGSDGPTWSRQSLCRSVEPGGPAGPNTARCKRCLNVLDGRETLRSIASHHRLAVQSLGDPATTPDPDEVIWCRALGSTRVMAHGFPTIRNALGTLFWATLSVCHQAGRGERADAVVPRCKRCLHRTGERPAPNLDP